MADKLRKCEATIRSRVDYEERAFHIVNRLIDNKVEGPYLIKCGQWISREHYKDVVEERAISYLCGYPLCDNTLQNIPKKQFHISTSTNRVYDISERKNFCSNQCLKASKQFSNQIPESPLWSRAKEQVVEIKLLPHTGISGIVGSEVIGISPQRLLETEIKRLEELDLRTTPSSKYSKQNNATSSVFKKTTTNYEPHTEDENKIQSLQTSVEDEKEGPDVGKNKEVDADTAQCSCNAPEDTKTLQLEETLQKEAAVEVNDENSLSGVNEIGMKNSGINTSHKIKETALFQQKNNLYEKQDVNSIKSCHVSTIVNKEMISGADLIREPSKSRVNENIHKVSEVEKSEEQTAKLDYLMKLLSKRKSVLSGMVDVVTALSDCHSDTAQITLPETVNGKVDIVLSENEPDKCKLPQHFPNQSSSQTNFIQPSPNQNSLEASGAKISSKIKKQSSRKSRRSILNYIGAILKTWITEDTTAYIQSLCSGGSDDSPMTFSDPRIKRGYADLCHRLDAQQKDFEDLLTETGGSDLNVSDSGRALKLVPDYNSLKTEAEAFQLKVAEFMAGKSLQPIQKKKDDDGKEEVFIPTVDAYDQRQIRIKIVLDRLDKFLPEVLGPLHLSIQAVSSYVRELVYTFRLEKDNIVFKPSEWILVAIFVLKMLGKKNRNISAAFAEVSSTRHFSILLKGIGHTLADLDVVVEDILSS